MRGSRKRITNNNKNHDSGNNMLLSSNQYSYVSSSSSSSSSNVLHLPDINKNHHHHHHHPRTRRRRFDQSKKKNKFQQQQQQQRRRGYDIVASKGKASFISILKNLHMATSNASEINKQNVIKKNSRRGQGGFYKGSSVKNKNKKKEHYSSRYASSPEHRDQFRFMERLQKIRREEKRRKKMERKKNVKKTSRDDKKNDTDAVQFLREIYRNAEYSIRDTPYIVEMTKRTYGKLPQSSKNDDDDDHGVRNKKRRKRKKKERKKRNTERYESSLSVRESISSIFDDTRTTKIISNTKNSVSQRSINGMYSTTDLVLNVPNVSHQSSFHSHRSKLSPSRTTTTTTTTTTTEPKPIVIENESNTFDNINMSEDKVIRTSNKESKAIERMIRTPGFNNTRGSLDFSPSPWTPARPGGTQGFGKLQWSRGSQGLGALMCSRGSQGGGVLLCAAPEV